MTAQERALEVIDKAISQGQPISYTPEPVEVLRALLKALREPSEAMIHAGFEEYPAIWTAAITLDDRVGIWKAMIDAALLETLE